MLFQLNEIQLSVKNFINHNLFFLLEMTFRNILLIKYE